jgi:hypothetical protein
MKKILINFFKLSIVPVVLLSCSTTDKVISEHSIQKRKYNKGFFVNIRNKEKISKTKLFENSFSKINDQKILKSMVIESENGISNQLTNLDEHYEANNNSLIASTNNKILINQNISKLNNSLHKEYFNSKKFVKVFNKINHSSRNDFNKYNSKPDITPIDDKKESDGRKMSIASFVCGLVGLVLFPFTGISALIFGILAVIFGIKGINKGNLRGFAIAGLILGIIDLLMFFIALLIISLFFIALLG